jgi:hypothetical protein
MLSIATSLSSALVPDADFFTGRNSTSAFAIWALHAMVLLENDLTEITRRPDAFTDSTTNLAMHIDFRRPSTLWTLPMIEANLRLTAINND